MTHLLFTYLTDDGNDAFFADAEHMFSEEFVRKYSKYKRWQDAKSTILGRLLLAYGLKNLYQLDIDNLKMNFSKDKKPFLENSSIQFNISHANDVIVCAITSVGDIGVDVEKINAIPIEDFKDQFSPSEYKTILGAPKVLEQFYTYWTQKEAVVKSNGSGLHIPLQSFEISNQSTFIADQPYYLNEISIDVDYKCHIATQSLIHEEDVTTISLKSALLTDFGSVNSLKSFR
ncbi:4'-phosphopantetheinyl transferase superfamily protein [Maribacter sp. BPC-D8]|uniref:4'-phosphopantetheinyl transferase family protein n=1 Tax=Maribacter sp. BPC-D8 TaxID=3053613 RepID=UPI002B47464C|nr:4'-phosphopantetheinyl transferase superfamily protein [Maribacter sp. BPC-D8]WRI28334.1 4'-phosphopantetheinyl transferase superfamily protein [Maribacter sp. BPC-D8]